MPHLAWFTRALTLLLVCAALGACAGGSELTCRKDVITGNEQCQPVSHSPKEAAVGAGAGAVTWGIVGCTVNGCPAPDTCNTRTKQCEPVTCKIDSDCAYGFHCDESSSRCR